jgi:hypothetical protein
MYIIYTQCRRWQPCWRMLTYADVCWRMLTYADVCWRMLTYADVCRHMPTYAVYSIAADVRWRMLTYADICRRMLCIAADVCWRMLTYADVCCIQYRRWRMLTYADVCWHMPTYPVYSIAADVCWRMLKYADVCRRMLYTVSPLTTACLSMDSTLPFHVQNYNGPILTSNAMPSPRGAPPQVRGLKLLVYEALSS